MSNFRQGTELQTIHICDFDPTIGAGVPGATPNLLLLRTDTNQLYYYAGPLDTDWNLLGGGGGSSPTAHFFTNVPVTGIAGGVLSGFVVPTTAPIIFPVGWRISLEAFASVEGSSPGFPFEHPQIPGPFPLAVASNGGGIGTLTIRRDPGPAAIIWPGLASPVFAPFVNLDTQPTGYAASMSISSRGFFVSDGAPHTYEVEIGIPSWFDVTWASDTGAIDIGLGLPIPGLGLQILAYPP